MIGSDRSSKKLLGGISGNARPASHPGWDLVLYVLDYAMQLVGVFSTRFIISGSYSPAMSRGILALLFSVCLLSAEFATDAYDSGALLCKKGSLLRNSFWGLAVAAMMDFLLFVFIACNALPDIMLTIAWVICLLTSLFAPLLLLKYQFDLFRTKNGTPLG